MPRPGRRIDAAGHLRSHDQRTRISSRTLRHRRCTRHCRRQADRRAHRHFAATERDEPARARGSLEHITAGSGRRASPWAAAPSFFDHDRILAFAMGKPLEAFGERVPSVRERPLPGARCRRLPSSSSTGSSSTDARALGDGGRHARRWPSTTSLPTPGSSRPIARTGCRSRSCSKSPCRRAAGWPLTWARHSTSDDDLQFRNLGGTAASTGRVTRRHRHADHRTSRPPRSRARPA